MEGEATVSVEKLATTVMKLALMSKEADNIIKVGHCYELIARKSKQSIIGCSSLGVKEHE